MEKITNEERARLEKLSKEYSQKSNDRWQKITKGLDKDQQDFISRNSSGKILNQLMDFLADGKKKPSDFIKQNCGWLFNGIIYDRSIDAFLYSLDNCNNFVFTSGWNRRSFRSGDYTYYRDIFGEIISSFMSDRNLDADFADILEGRLTEEQAAFKAQAIGWYSYNIINKYILTYEIDMGNTRVISYVKNALESGSGTGIDYNLLAAVFRCKNEEIHDSVCRLLIAARLQEGLRQAICENCDCGRIEPFIKIIQTIEDNNLIRFSSVKRAVGCWLGLLTPESTDLERISGKSLNLIIKCFKDKDFRESCLKSEDSMELYTALWTLARLEFNHCAAALEQAVEKGTAHQAMVCGLFLNNIINQRIKQSLAVKAVILRHKELDVTAVFLPQISCVNSVYDYREQKSIKTPMSQRFESREQAEQLFDILKELLDNMPKKDIEFNPCVFPWNAEALTKTDIVKRLCVIASDLEDNDKIDEVCPFIPLIKSDGYYGSGRKTQIEMLLSDPKTEVQLDTLVSLAADKETYSRKTVYQFLNKCDLKEKHYAMLSDMLKYKADDLRKNIIDLLFKQDGDRLLECVKSLVSDKKEEKRTAGLDMIIRIAESDNKKYSQKEKDKFTALIACIEKPTSKEKILIERISGNKDNKEKQEGCGLYKSADSYEPVVDMKYIEQCKAEFVKQFPNTRLFGNKPKGVLGQLFKGKKSKDSADFNSIVTKLDKLIEEHKNDEYLDAVGETRLLGNTQGYSRFMVKNKDGKEEIAFKELWDKFYEENINDGIAVFKLNLYLRGGSGLKLEEEAFGPEYSLKTSYMHLQRINQIIGYYYSRHFDRGSMINSAAALCCYIAFEAKKESLYSLVQSPYNSRSITFYLDGERIELGDRNNQSLVTVINDYRFSDIIFLLNSAEANDDSHFADIFAIRVAMGKRFGFFDSLKESAKANYNGYYQLRRHIFTPFSADTLILAAYKGVISKGYMYKMLMTVLVSSALENLSSFISYKKSGETRASSRYWNYKDCEGFIKSILGINSAEKLAEHTLTKEDNKRLDFVYEIAENVINAVLDTELKRGDSETEFSNVISSIKRIYGGENFVKILAAMGKDTFARSSYFYSYNGVSKKQSLSYLLGVCVPDKDDDAKKLKKLLKETDVTENRVVEASLFSSSWLEIIEEYLGWNGFKSACYYFIAHTNETMDEKTKAVVAKYTPISAEDLSMGAFDIDWFREALAAIGEKRFDTIYKAAKYITDGAKHSRARKYADAVMGKMDKAAIQKEISQKRNKDTLMAYGLIPLENEQDMVERYLFIQQFKKESKQFGAQRRASESKASELALQNLSKNAGFSDVSRLTLKMESKLFENIKPLLQWNEIEEIKLKLEIDENGKAELLCEKNGKALKSVPAKYNKNEKVLEFTATKKQLTEQYRRTRFMFEEAMESETIFTAEELSLLCENPVLKPIVSRLVYITREKSGDKLGFFGGNVLADFEGKETKITKKTKLKIAHPYNIYKDGHWHEYQKYLFDKGIVQPFKQVFRELYVKTDEEAQAYRSTRYAGNQIQPKKTVACLKSRRWIADVEEGLQKVYYKENIIASIYALADWFSPSDIEAPTLEWVEFFDRKTYKAIKIEDVPDIIFSEVMRDVDLAVSVAHAGGVDPETSHSTIEMRSAIVEFTLPLFKLKNVKLEGTHAFISGERADYSIHLGSGVVHLQGGPMINILPVHSQHRGKLFLPFVDEDPKTSQIISEILLFAEDKKIKDPFILDQIK